MEINRNKNMNSKDKNILVTEDNKPFYGELPEIGITIISLEIEKNEINVNDKLKTE